MSTVYHYGAPQHSSQVADVDHRTCFTYCGVCNFWFVPDHTPHSKDEDCTVEDGHCIYCGVDHTETCLICGGHGFHKNGCEESDAPLEPIKMLGGVIHYLCDVGSIQSILTCCEAMKK